MDNLYSKFTHLACDANGTLYGVLPPSEDVPHIRIAVLNARHALLRGEASADKVHLGQALADAQLMRILVTSPPCTARITAIAASPSGHHLLLTGYTGEDGDLALVGVVDIHAGRPQRSPQSTSTSSALPSIANLFTSPATSRQTEQLEARSAGKAEAPPGVRTWECPLVVLGEEHFQYRLGLRIRQASWVPTSESHVAVLTSDNRLLLFHTARPLVPEQSFALRPDRARPTGARPLGLDSAGKGSTGSRAKLVAFVFGPPWGWGALSVFFVSSTGLIYALCPITPFGWRMPGRVLASLLQEPAPPGTVSWVQSAFGVEAARNPEAHEGWPVLPHVLEHAAPQLVGPLQPAPDLQPREVAQCLTLLPEPSTSSSMGDTNTKSSPSSLLFPFSLATVQPTPAACVSALAVGYSSGRVLLYACAGNAVGPSWGEAEVEMMANPDGEIRAVRYSCSLSSVSGEPPLLLIDALDLALRPVQPSSSRADDEDDDEIDEDRPGAQSSQYAMGLGAQPATLPGVLLAWHQWGAWAVHLPWLTELVARMKGKAPRGRNTQSGDGVDLPAPQLVELVVSDSDAPLLSYTPLGDPLSRSGLVVLHPNPELGLCFYRCSRTPLLPSIAAAAAPPGATPAKTPAAWDTELDELYREVLAGPRNLALPKATGLVLSGTPSGLAHLNDAINVLRARYVEFAVYSHRTLRSRHASLAEEAKSHADAAHELQDMQDALRVRAAELESRLMKAQNLGRNLLKRASLLTSLHWSLPRPLSDEERTLKSELDAADGRVAAMEAEWKQLAKRAEKEVAAQKVAAQSSSSTSSAATEVEAGSRRSARQGASSKSTGVAPSQLEKMHTALAEQVKLATSCGAQVEALQAALAAHVDGSGTVS